MLNPFLRLHPVMMTCGLVCVSLLASCGTGNGIEPVRMPVAKAAAGELEVKAYFFTTPEDFGFGARQQEPGVAGTYSAEAGEALVKSLARRRGFEVFENAPAKSSARAGKKRELKVVREFIYPTEYGPAVVDRDGDGTIQSATPATPTAFETRELGVVLGYSAKRVAGGKIEINLDLKRSSFLGFVNYGKPITSPAKGLFGRKVDVTLTENRIEMPVFDVKRLQTAVRVSEGDFIAVGGFIPNTPPGKADFEAWAAGSPETAGRPFVALIQVGGK